MKLGTNDIGSVYLGTNEISKVYLGTNLVWESGFDADYQAVLDYATTQGYTLPSLGQQELQNQIIVNLKSAGIWSGLDLFYVFATDGDSDFASINWKDPNNFECIEVNSPTFTSNQGFASNGTSYLNTDYNVLSESTNFELLSNGLAYYITDVGSIHHGARDGNDDNQIYYGSVAKRHQKLINNYSTGNNTYFASIRNGSNVAQYENNTNVTNYINTPTALPNQNYMLLALNNGGTALVAGTAEISFFTMGGEFNNSDMYNAWNNYFNAI